MTALGFAALIYGLFGKGLGTAGVLIWMGIGALLIFIGVSMLSMRIVVSGRVEALGTADPLAADRAWIVFLITPIGWIYIGYFRSGTACCRPSSTARRRPSWPATTHGATLSEPHRRPPR